MDARICGLRRRRALSRLVRETCPIARLEHEVTNDRFLAYSGKYLQSDESQCEKGDESRVRVLVIALWCLQELNIGNAWCWDRHSMLWPTKTKTDP